MEDVTDYAKLVFAIADDKPFIRNIILRMLRAGKARDVLVFENGEQTAKALNDRSGAVDILISDWNMEPVNGLELLRGIRTGSYKHIARDLPFIMLTGHSDMKVVKTALAMDVDGYLVKPVSAEKLQQTIFRALQRKWVPKPAEIYANIGRKQVDSSTVDSQTHQPACTVVSLAADVDKAWLENKVEEFKADTRAQMSLAESSSDPKRREPLANVVPGNVLAEDVELADGTVLLNAGTQLQQRLLDRLHEIETESNDPVWLWVSA